MKKVLAIFAVTSLVALTSCGGSASTETASDSTAVATDSSVVATDSTATATDSTATEVK